MPSSWTSTWSFTVINPSAFVPQQIFPVSTTAGHPNNVKIDWNAVLNVNSYNYQVDTSASFSSSLLINGTKAYISSSSGNTDTEYQTNNLTQSRKYYWRVRTIVNGSYSDWSPTWWFIVGNPAASSEIETGNHDFAIYPNPVKGSADVYILLDIPETCTLEVYDLPGKKILTLIENKKMDAGQHRIPLIENNIPAGMYFIRLQGGGKTSVKKFIVE